MTDFFIGGLIVGASAATIVALIIHQWRRDRTPTTPATLPNRLVIVRGDDHPIDRHDLAAVRVLLYRQAAAWFDDAYQQVLDQVAADEAESGVAAVEDAANERRSA